MARPAPRRRPAPELVLASADRIAARDAIKKIKITFLKEGFAKGFAAGVARWYDEEVASELKNRVSAMHLEGLEDPAGILTLSDLLQLAEACEDDAADVGYLYSSSRSRDWKQDMLTREFTALAQRNYHFRDDDRVLFEYNVIDQLALVLRPTTDPIVEEAIATSEDQ